MTFGEHGVRRRLTAPAVGVVHDIVMEQRKGVHEFERGAGVEEVGVDVEVAVAPVAGRPAAAVVELVLESGLGGSPALSVGVALDPHPAAKTIASDDPLEV